MRRSLVRWLFVLVVAAAGPAWAVETTAEASGDHDLDAIQARGVLRLITRNSPNTYFLYRGEQMGFEYELARGLASRLGVELEVVVAPEGIDPIDLLQEGRGDLVGASCVAREVRAPSVRFSRPYKRVSRVVVVRDDCTSIQDPGDLVGQEVWVPEGGRSYWQLRSLELELGGLVGIRCAPAERSPELIMADVAAGTVNATVVDTDVASLAMSFHGNLKIACTLGPPRPVAWAVRAGSEGLLASADQFLQDIRGTFFFNHITRRYYDSGAEYERFRESVFLAWQSGRLSRFDQHIRKHAGALGVDWLLIAALIYEESSFNPAARSSAGARGLLQLMPRTALALGVSDLHDPDENILAGIRYLREQYELFDEALTPEDRLRFALASYNVGVGHVRDAQRLAAEMGENPSSWESVSEILVNLSRREYYERTQYGYCRGDAAVRYVEDVLRRWEIYSDYLRQHSACGSESMALEDEGAAQERLSAVTWPDEQPGA